MKNENCITCDKLGASCSGPNFLLMSSQEVVEWCKARKIYLKMTRDKLAELSGVPMGTLNRFFSGTNAYFYFETARPILKVLVSDAWALDNCFINQSQKQDSTTLSMLQKIEMLERDNEFLKRENEDLKNVILSALTDKR